MCVVIYHRVFKWKIFQWSMICTYAHEYLLTVFCWLCSSILLVIFFILNMYFLTLLTWYHSWPHVTHLRWWAVGSRHKEMTIWQQKGCLASWDIPQTTSKPLIGSDAAALARYPVSLALPINHFSVRVWYRTIKWIDSQFFYGHKRECFVHKTNAGLRAT